MVLTVSRAPDTHLVLVFMGVIPQQSTALENKWDYVIAGKTHLRDSVGSV